MEVIRIGSTNSVLVIGISDMQVSDDSNAYLKTYSLGSCIGVAALDRDRQVGGLLHILLPESSIQPSKSDSHPYMFADTGIPRLFHALYDLGASKSNIVVKVAGGADMKSTGNTLRIGERNLNCTRQILERNGVRIKSLQVGGCISRTMTLQLMTGKVLIQSPGREDIWM